MIPLLVDHNFNEHIIEGLLRREAAISLIRVRTLGLAEAEDPVVLQRAGEEGRVLLTHDRRTIPRFVELRLEAGLPMPGVFVVPLSLPVGRAIEELLIAVHCFSPEEGGLVLSALSSKTSWGS